MASWSALHCPEEKHDDGSGSAGTESDTAADRGDDDGEDNGDYGEQTGVLCSPVASATNAAGACHHVDEAEDAEDDDGEDEVTDEGMHFCLSSSVAVDWLSTQSGIAAASVSGGCCSCLLPGTAEYSGRKKVNVIYLCLSLSTY